MRTRRFTTFSLCVALTCISAFVSCKQQLVTNSSFKSDRLVTIAVSPDDASKCEVDFPIAFVRVRNNTKIRWKSDDNAYTVHFVSYPGGPSPENPFNPPTNDVYVPAGQKSPQQRIQNSRPGAYYKFEIRDANNSVCKTADDDHDTGLNIKP
jgi:hypothetical protein